MNTEYRVTLKSMLGTALVMLIIGCLLIAAGILHGKFFVFMFGPIFLAWPFAIRYRLRITVGDDRIA